jgi:hypothetical protein
MAQEMGKPIRDGVAEIQKCAATCDFYTDNAERFLAPEPVKTEAQKSYLVFQPLGVVLAVMPWNFPFWQVFRFAAPGRAAWPCERCRHRFASAAPVEPAMNSRRATVLPQPRSEPGIQQN